MKNAVLNRVGILDRDRVDEIDAARLRSVVIGVVSDLELSLHEETREPHVGVVEVVNL